MRIKQPQFRKPCRDWPMSVADAPDDLVSLVADALCDFGPDGHCDGADVIAALVMDWCVNYRK